MSISFTNHKTVVDEYLIYGCLHDGNHGRPRSVSLHLSLTRKRKFLDSLTGLLPHGECSRLDATPGMGVYRRFQQDPSSLAVTRCRLLEAGLSLGRWMTRSQKVVAPYRCWSPPQLTGTKVMRTQEVNYVVNSVIATLQKLTLLISNSVKNIAFRCY